MAVVVGRKFDHQAIAAHEANARDFLGLSDRAQRAGGRQREIGVTAGCGQAREGRAWPWTAIEKCSGETVDTEAQISRKIGNQLPQTETSQLHMYVLQELLLDSLSH